MRSPLKDKPLRNPGQSLDQKITDLQFDAIFHYMVAVILVLFAAFEWWKSLFNIPPTPILFSIIALAAVIFATVKFRAILKEIKSYKQGRDGEKVVGQNLEVLRKDGAKVYHDICAENFNIDHLVVSTKGIFVIETKTWSKPDKGHEKLRFDGKTVFKSNQPLEPNPTIQAIANAKHIRDLLKKSTGRSFDIQPIVTFPGWFVERATHSPSYLEPWVLNPSFIEGNINRSKTSLSNEDVHLISDRLSRHIQSIESACEPF